MRDNKKYICEKCGLVDENMTRVVERTETYNVKGEPIPVLARVRVCESCNKEISDEVLDDITLQAAYDVYRSKHKIVFPSEIRALRETYGLSQRGLGALLGWGPITIHRYESGSLPDESHNQVLRLMQDPFTVARLFLENKDSLDRVTYKKMLGRLNTILSEKAPAKAAEVLCQGSYFMQGPPPKKPTLYTGFISFQPEILMEMMVFFASKAGGVLKTKLNKLLWYADFVHYKHYTLSISGATYNHLQYGPVPQNYESFLSALYSTDALTIEERDLGTNKEGEPMVGLWLSATREPKLTDIALSGISVLESVQLYFQNIGSKRISDLSHKEEGYIATKHKEAISYAYADVLKVDPLAKSRRVLRINTTGRKQSPYTTEKLAALKASLARSTKKR
jgi:putative zinc finger/helix-turn-helix YgiT family protein